MTQVYLFPCGEVGVDPTVPDRSLSKNPFAFTGLFRSPKRRIWLPVKAFLVDSPKGKILIDTSWDSRVRTAPIRTLSFRMWFASKPRLPEGESVLEELAKLSLAPKDLTAVLMSHMDIDHDSGLKMVKEAPKIYVSEEESKAMHSGDLRYVKRPWKGIPLSFMPFEEDPSAPFGKSWDVFHDHTLIAYLAPGHSRGSVVFEVRGERGFVLITGDTGYNRKSWEEGKLPGPIYDKEKLKKALAWVEARRKEPDCLGALASHDAEEKRSVILVG
jgi:N-acyl homoserine lactone hydrolase